MTSIAVWLRLLPGVRWRENEKMRQETREIERTRTEVPGQANGKLHNSKSKNTMTFLPFFGMHSAQSERTFRHFFAFLTWLLINTLVPKSYTLFPANIILINRIQKRKNRIHGQKITSKEGKI